MSKLPPTTFADLMSRLGDAEWRRCKHPQHDIPMICEAAYSEAIELVEMLKQENAKMYQAILKVYPDLVLDNCRECDPTVGFQCVCCSMGEMLIESTPKLPKGLI